MKIAWFLNRFLTYFGPPKMDQKSIKNRSSGSCWAKMAPRRYHLEPTWLQEPIFTHFLIDVRSISISQWKPCLQGISSIHHFCIQIPNWPHITITYIRPLEDRKKAWSRRHDNTLLTILEPCFHGARIWRITLPFHVLRVGGSAPHIYIYIYICI